MLERSPLYPQYSDDEQESRFTHPKDFCRNPHLWHSADSDSTEYEVLELVAAFVRALQPEVVVETGTAFGYGAFRIGQALKANGHGTLYTIEQDERRYDKLCASFAKYDLPVRLVLGSSLSWTPPDDVGFAFFDSYPETRALEFRRYYPYLKPGTTVAFHDAAPHHAVWKDIVDLEREGMLKAIRLRTPRGLAVAEVV